MHSFGLQEDTISKELYNKEFYENQSQGSSQSAEFFASHLQDLLKSRSVVDFGCGHGSWLSAFGRYGAEKLLGFDGHWIRQEDIQDPMVRFEPLDLAQKIVGTYGTFDLAISLETAEHLRPESARIFIENITIHSDVVMFSAAYENQGGTSHINERKHTYWAGLFSELGYVPYDIFRPIAWGNAKIDFWYQQNTFLYVKESSDIRKVLHSKGHFPIGNIEFMNCVHPELYDTFVGKTKAIPKQIWSLMAFLGSLLRAINR
jgi:SAM-dependent methyltransferase